MKNKRLQKYLLILILILISFAIYANSLNGSFLVDDDSGILNNPRIRDYKVYFAKHFRLIPGVLDELKRVFLWHFWGASVLPYHLCNVLAHIACVVLLFILCNILFSNTVLSFLAALIFSLHPIHTEAVSWISGGSYVFSGFFFIAAMIFYIKSQKSVFNLALAALAFGFCLFVGNSAASLPLMFIFYDLFFRDKTGEGKAVRKVRLAALFAVLIISAMFIAIFLVSRNKYARTIFYFRGAGYLVVITKAIPYYLKLLYLPIARGLYHPFGYDTTQTGEISPGFFLALAILVLCVFLFFKCRRRRPPVSFGIAWFFIAYLPYSNIIPACNIISERYLYLPSAGFAIVMSYLILEAWRLVNEKSPHKALFRYIVISAVTLFLGSYAALTLKRNIEYSNIITYWETNVNNFPGGFKAYNNLAGTFYAMGNLQQAIAYSWVNLMINPQQPHVWCNLGKVYRELGNLKEAEYCYQEALKLDKNFPPGQKGLSEVEALIKARPKKSAQ